MMMRLLATIMVLLLILPATASAATFNLGYGTRTVDIAIQANQDAAYIIPLEVGDKLIVDLEVVDGGPVDFYLTNKTAYEVYLAGASGTINFNSLYYVDEYSRTSTGSMGYTYNSLIENELVVLVDNTGNVGEAASGPVTVHGTIIVQKNVWTLQNIIITVILVILIIAFMVGFRYPWNRKK